MSATLERFVGFAALMSAEWASAGSVPIGRSISSNRRRLDYAPVTRRSAADDLERTRWSQSVRSTHRRQRPANRRPATRGSVLERACRAADNPRRARCGPDIHTGGTPSRPCPAPEPRCSGSQTPADPSRPAWGHHPRRRPYGRPSSLTLKNAGTRHRVGVGWCR